MDEPNTPASKTALRPALVTEREIAPLLGVSVNFLQKDRRNARAIPFIKLGDRCLYDPDAVLAAVRARTIGGNAPSSDRMTRTRRGER